MTDGQVVEVDYTNWRGERTDRRIVPIRIFYGMNSWHREHQWLLEAFDIGKGEPRIFAMSQIHSWKPEKP